MLRLPRRAVGLGVLSLGFYRFASAASAASADAPAVATLPLSLAVAVEGGEPVQDAAWLDGQMAEVERLLGASGVRFRRGTVRPLRVSSARLETAADRDDLAPFCEERAVNVFVVASLRDVDDGVSVRRGVHWRCRRHPATRYVIVSSIAGPSVLAHELGHYLGLGHSPVRDNLMSYQRSGAPVFLDAAQARAIRSSARAVVASGEVSAAVVGPERAASPQ